MISKGGIIAGGFIGEALAFLALDPITSGFAGVVGAVIPVLSDVVSRKLSERKQIILGATAAFAIKKRV